MKPEYLSKQIAAQELGLSVRRVLELSNAGKIRRKRVIDPTTQREQTVLLAADVARLAAASTSTAIAAPAGAADVRLARLNPALPPIEPAAPRLWMTAAEAADYSGLPASFLIHAIDTGALRALDVGVRAGGRYRIRRADIDALEGRKQAITKKR
jgi:excisionase family DNA binding protein